MPHYPDTPAELRRLGLRVTPQRLLILDILQHSDRHLTADDIHSRLRERFPALDISTVYRTLETLTNLGMVQRVSLGETHDHYEWVDVPHYHVICRRCGATTHFSDDLLDQLRALLGERLQFQVERAYVEVFGLCAGCLGQEDSGERDGIPSHQH